MAPEYQSPGDIFSRVHETLSTDPSKASGNAVYLFELSGEEGGQYHIVVRDGTGEAGHGPVESPNTTFTMAAGDLVDLANGRLDGTMAFMSGKLKIKGDMGLAMKLQSLF